MLVLRSIFNFSNDPYNSANNYIVVDNRRYAYLEIRIYPTPIPDYRLLSNIWSLRNAWTPKSFLITQTSITHLIYPYIRIYILI